MDTKTFGLRVAYPPGGQPMLAALVEHLRYKDWKFGFRGQGGGLRLLTITIDTASSVDVPSLGVKVGDPFLVEHTLPIPPLPYTREEWERWLLDQIVLVERHEACEHFEINGEHPFHPPHGGEGNPYEVSRRHLKIGSSGEIDGAAVS